MDNHDDPDILAVDAVALEDEFAEGSPVVLGNDPAYLRERLESVGRVKDALEEQRRMRATPRRFD
jgi:hypothetical protein